MTNFQKYIIRNTEKNKKNNNNNNGDTNKINSYATINN